MRAPRWWHNPRTAFFRPARTRKRCRLLERLRIVSRPPIVALMRTVSASVLAFVTVASTIPLAVFSAGGSSAHVSCPMPCCAGRGASGGCATGACGGGVPIAPPKPKPPYDPVCGSDLTSHGSSSGAKRGRPQRTAIIIAASRARRNRLATSTKPHHFATPQAAPTRHVVATALSRPCAPECRAGGAAATQTVVTRDAALDYAGRPRPPTASRLTHRADTSFRLASAMRRRSRPRAPPISSLNPFI